MSFLWFMTVYVCLCVFAMILYSLEHEAFESPASSAWATSKWDSSDNRQSLETKQHMAGKENILDRIIEIIRLFLRVISKFPKWSSEVHHQNVMCECGSTPCTLVKMTKGNSIAVIKMGYQIITPKLHFGGENDGKPWDILVCPIFRFSLNTMTILRKLFMLQVSRHLKFFWPCHNRQSRIRAPSCG